MSKKILIGVAWPYVNGDIHLGHLAGYLLPADIFARYHRIIGDDCLMVSGSDCHGTPITIAADKENTTPTEIVNSYHIKVVELFKQYNLSYNLYTKTTTENHKKVVQDMFMNLLENGYIVKGTMRQYYSEGEGKFLPDRYVEGECPHCHAKNQRSDQCESCGRWLEDGELIDPISKNTLTPVILKDTEHYFLDFEKLTPQLTEYVESKKEIWRDWVYKETIGWLNEGLKKRAITRDIDWAVDLPIEELKKLPQEVQLSDYTGKKIYVWFEAVIGYLSAAIEWSSLNKDSDFKEGIFYKQDGQDADWKDYWLSPECEIYNFMGQDNLVFHTLMWPAQLMGSNKGYTLPHNVVVNKFMNLEGKKFSKSRKWTIDSKRIAQNYGTDLIRYYVCANLPENKEGDFTWNNFIAAVNNELVASPGNFINRTLKFLESKYQGELSDEKFEMDGVLKGEIEATYIGMSEYISNCQFVNALNELMALSKFANKYFDDQKIWIKIKEDEESAKVVLLNLLNIVENLGILMSPFLPSSSEKLFSMLGKEMPKPVLGNNQWNAEYSNSYKLNGIVEVLFNKLDPAVVLSKKDN
jgi:methionyl-tRNA synthetase